MLGLGQLEEMLFHMIEDKRLEVLGSKEARDRELFVTIWRAPFEVCNDERKVSPDVSAMRARAREA